VVVSVHNHHNGSKRRLYLFKINSKSKFKLLTIKEYGIEEPMRNTYLSISIDFYVDDHPLVICHEHSSSGQVIVYLIKNDRFELFQVFDKFMSHYCFSVNLFENKLWSIDNAGKLRCLELVRKYGEVRTAENTHYPSSTMRSLRNWETQNSANISANRFEQTTEMSPGRQESVPYFLRKFNQDPTDRSKDGEFHTDNTQNIMGT
jgi:hypothetical protein